ncbi:hypothetical protein ACLB2K_043539 [Fragaria x ananassa]
MLLRMFLEKEKLRPFEYDEKVDMWAVGVIIAELHLMRPLFIAKSYADQLKRDMQSDRGTNLGVMDELA